MKKALLILCLALLFGSCAIRCAQHPKQDEIGLMITEFISSYRAFHPRASAELKYCVTDDKEKMNMLFTTVTRDGVTMPVILVTARMVEEAPVDILRCGVAHELAHFLLGHQTSPKSLKEIELEADRVAIEILRAAVVLDPDKQYISMLEFLKAKNIEGQHPWYTKIGRPSLDERIGALK